MTGLSRSILNLVAVVALATPIQAAASSLTIIQPVSVSSDDFTASGSFAIENMVDQSGLSTGYTAGDTDFDDYVVNTNPTHNFGDSFLASEPAPGSVTFDLGSVFSVDRMAMWGTDGFFSVQDFALFASEAAGGTFASLGSFTQDFQSNGDTAQVFEFASTTAQFIRMDITSSYLNDNTPGIGEVIFREAAPIPLPAAAFLLLGGLGALGVVKRRARKAA